MKPATDPISGEVTEKVTRTRVIPASEQNSAKPDLWEYLYALGNDPKAWERHIVYVYRMDGGVLNPVAKTGSSSLQLPGGRTVPVYDQQEMEFALRDLSGGSYRILVKRGPQIVAAETISIGGPVRQIIPVDPPAGPGHSAPAGTTYGAEAGATAAVAGRAFDAIGSARREEAEIGFGAMRLGLESMGRAMEMQSRGGGADSELTRQLMVAMMARLTEDPMQKMLQFLTVMKELNAVSSGPAGGLADKLMSAAIEKFLAPPAGTGPVNMGAALVSVLPSLADKIAETTRNVAEIKKSDLQIATIQSGAMRPAIPATPGQVIPPAPPSPAPQAAPAPGAPTMDFVFSRIMQIFAQPISAHDAADEAMTLLDSLDPNATTQLAAAGEQGLLQLFSTQPILRQATANMPRLIEFIREFLKMHAEDMARDGQVPPAPPKQPLPN